MKKQLSQIVDYSIAGVWKSDWLNNNSVWDVDRAARQLLAREGYDPQFGRSSSQAHHSGPVTRSARDQVAPRRIQSRRPHQSPGHDGELELVKK